MIERVTNKLLINTPIRILRYIQDTSKFHNHPFMEICYVVKGRAYHIINGKESTLEAGNYFFAGYEDVHRFIVDENEEFNIINCIFLPEVIAADLKGSRKLEDVIFHENVGIERENIIQEIPGYIFRDKASVILDILNTIDKECISQKPAMQQYIRSLMVQIIIISMRSISGDKANSYSKLTAYMINEINRNFYNDNLMMALCGNSGYTMSYMSRTFKKDTGKTFKQYLQDVRIKNSCILLSTSEKKVSEIAEIVGYKDLKYFNEIFKKSMKMTPIEYRKISSIRYRVISGAEK